MRGGGVKVPAALIGSRVEQGWRGWRQYALLAMGLRRGEIVGLRWTDSDLDNRVIYVRQQAQRPRGVLYDDESKAVCGRSACTV